MGRVIVILVALAVAAAGQLPLSVASRGTAPVASTDGSAYVNPLRGDFGESLPDPTVIRARDGYWYAYATAAAPNTDPGRRHNLPIIRSADLVNWEYQGDVFDGSNFPRWLDPTQEMWAPEIDYFDGRYVLYYTALNSPEYEKPNRSIGVATAPTPTGPWTDAGQPVIEPRWWEPFPGERSFAGTIDPEVVTTPQGRRFIYFGGYNGGVHVNELSTDGLSAVGEATMIASRDRYEAMYVVHRAGWYYMFVSTANCCSGPVSGYSVYVLRSRNPKGPFLDRFGHPMLGARPGGTPVLTQNGNSRVGTGHNAIATDLSGQDYLLYHGFDRHSPFTSGPIRLKRQLQLDRLDWVDGWPVARGGAGPSDTHQAAPDIDTVIADAFEPTPQELRSPWEPDKKWLVETEAAGNYLATATHRGTHVLRARRAVSGDLRIRAAFRLPEQGSIGASGFVLAQHGHGASVRVTIDRHEHALVVEVVARRGVDKVVAPLHHSFDYEDWHELEIELRKQKMDVVVTNAGLYDPLAEASIVLPVQRFAGRLGLLSTDAATHVDDVTVAQLYDPNTRRLPDPKRKAMDPANSDEFDGTALDKAWTWVREPAATLEQGRLVFPLQDRSFNLADNEAALLVRDAPQGEWMVETKLDLAFGDATPHNTPQAGIGAYVDDDSYVWLMNVAHGPVRRTDFVQEMTHDGQLYAGAAWIGPPGEETTYLRLHHTVAGNGEHVLRAGTSPNGAEWTWGSAYTLPPGSDVKIALTAFGGGHTAYFDHLRTYR